uniref:S28 family serine protease n=1 Tax=Streptomyces corallincola TaxID=2851888 RepID=UPI001FE5D66F|nr:S28 family serine protease [Streptomyces corallincola]
MWTRRNLLTSAVTALSAATAVTAGGAAAAAATGMPARVGSGARGSGGGDIAAALAALPGLRIIEEREGAEPGYRFFVLGLRQPIDHTGRTPGTFEQRLTLLHTSRDRPTVLFSTGYAATLSPRRSEPAVLLGANQLQVEHRYFGDSVPPGTGFAHLTVRQAADDHHRVVRLFRGLYPGGWVSTGSSKGGMVSVYHRRFHPHDVDGTVAYSAPDNVDDRDDSAYLRFLETVGTPDIREALRDVQRQALALRTELVARYADRASADGTGFRIVGSADRAFEAAVLRAPFMFWQRGNPGDAAGIPGPAASADALYTWLDRVTGLNLYTDAVARDFIPYFYQLGTEMGYFDVATDYLAGLLRYPGVTEPRSFVPRDIPMRFDRDAMPDIDHWVRRHGSGTLFVNGGQDPAVAEHFRPGPRDSRLLWAPEANHGVALSDLTEPDRTEALEMLAQWGGVTALPGAGARGIG